MVSIRAADEFPSPSVKAALLNLQAAFPGMREELKQREAWFVLAVKVGCVGCGSGGRVARCSLETAAFEVLHIRGSQHVGGWDGGGNGRSPRPPAIFA